MCVTSDSISLSISTRSTTSVTIPCLLSQMVAQVTASDVPVSSEAELQQQCGRNGYLNALLLMVIAFTSPHVTDNNKQSLLQVFNICTYMYIHTCCILNMRNINWCIHSVRRHFTGSSQYLRIRNQPRVPPRPLFLLLPFSSISPQPRSYSPHLHSLHQKALHQSPTTPYMDVWQVVAMYKYVSMTTSLTAQEHQWRCLQRADVCSK